MKDWDAHQAGHRHRYLLAGIIAADKAARKWLRNWNKGVRPRKVEIAQLQNHERSHKSSVLFLRAVLELLDKSRSRRIVGKNRGKAKRMTMGFACRTKRRGSI